MGSDLIDSVKVVTKRSKPKSAGKVFPPGFRFHPTDEELVLYYLKRKICRKSVKLDIIGEVDVYKWDPQDLPGQSKLKTGDRQWFFFSPRDRKYPNGRSSRATMNGYWKATGKDRFIKRKSSLVGIKKTLVYYQGRAPLGLRTDWVMHEYTMVEEELQKCPFAQDHYVLYKIFKKSGPGPKNGEQYGAPFVEEEWSDNEYVDATPLNMIDVHGSRSVQEEDNNVLSDDIVEYLNKIIDEPELLPPLPQITEKIETYVHENSSSLPQITEKTSYLLENSSSLVEKDFLEMDDLVGPDPGICSLDPAFNSFSEFDFYHESGTFGGNQHLELQAALMDNLEYGPENSGLVSEVVSHDHEAHDELPISYDLWNHEQGESSVTTSQTTNHAVFQSSSGMVIEENPRKPEHYPNQCPQTNTQQDSDNTDSWFSSALWAFVDSIPTTPASASESSALVNKAFERMSSFGRSKNINLAEAMKRLEKQKPLRSSRGFVYFSVLGVLFAILVVFIASSVETLGRYIWS